MLGLKRCIFHLIMVADASFPSQGGEVVIIGIQVHNRKPSGTPMYYLLYYSVLAVTCGMLDVVALVVHHEGIFF